MAQEKHAMKECIAQDKACTKQWVELCWLRKNLVAVAREAVREK